MALGMLIGTLVIVDLRLLGLGMRRQSVAQLSRFLGPWTLFGVASMIITGIPLFMSEAISSAKALLSFTKWFSSYALSTLHFTLHRKVTASGASQDSGLGKLAASLSLLCCWAWHSLAGPLPFYKIASPRDARYDEDTLTRDTSMFASVHRRKAMRQTRRDRIVVLPSTMANTWYSVNHGINT